jgi:hypothetical protein
MLRKFLISSAFATLIAANLCYGQGSQLPKYTVSTLPSAPMMPKYVVQVIDGYDYEDCLIGGGFFNVLCAPVAGVWHSINNGSSFSNPMTTLGDTMYGGASGAPTRLAGNTTTTKKFLSQTGDGTNSAAPAWSALASADLPGGGSTTVNGQTCTLGSPCTVPASASTLTGYTGTSGDVVTATGTLAGVQDSGVALGSLTTAIIPANSRMKVIGASITEGWDSQQEVYISAQSGGSGYSGTGTATPSGGTCSVQPTIGAWVSPTSSSSTTGPLAFSVTTQGSCTVAPTSVVIAGFTTGSDASVTLAHRNSLYTPWSQTMTTLPPFAGRIASYDNYATAGSGILDGIALFTSQNLSSYCADSSHTNFVVVGSDYIRNSLQGPFNVSANAVDYKTAYAQWTALITPIRAAGCKVIVDTVLPQEGTITIGNSVFEAGRQSVNQLIRVGKNYDYLLDFGAQIQDFTDPNLISIDKIHPTQAGQDYMAALGAASIAAGGQPTALGMPWTRGFFLGNTLTYGGSMTVENPNTVLLPHPNASAVLGYYSGGVYINSTSASSTNYGSIYLDGYNTSGAHTRYASFTSSGATLNINPIFTNTSAALVPTLESSISFGYYPPTLSSYMYSSSGTVGVPGALIFVGSDPAQTKWPLASFTSSTAVFPGLVTASGGVVSGAIRGDDSAVSCTVGPASGTGATCVPAANHHNTTNSGDLTLTTGTGTTTGTAATVVLYNHTPTGVSTLTNTVGGTLAASTSYCYRVAAEGFTSGLGIPSAETCVTTGSTTSTNTVTVKWNSVANAAAYSIYGRPTGAELLLASGVIPLGYADTGAITPSGALPVADTILPYPNCMAEVHTASAVSTVGYTLENNIGFTRYAFSAPAASTVYTIHYQCGY